MMPAGGRGRSTVSRDEIDGRGGGGRVLEKTTTGTEEKAGEAEEGTSNEAEPVATWGS